MKPILLDLSVLSNRHAVEAALAVVNGRYTKRTFVYYHQIANEIGRLESELSIQLRLPRGVWDGVSAVSDSLVGGSKRSKAVGTRILFKRILNPLIGLIIVVLNARACFCYLLPFLILFHHFRHSSRSYNFASPTFEKR